jgi:hypothetical protein
MKYSHLNYDLSLEPREEINLLKTMKLENWYFTCLLPPYLSSLFTSEQYSEEQQQLVRDKVIEILPHIERQSLEEPMQEQ